MKSEKKKLIKFLKSMEYEDLVDVINWVALTGVSKCPKGYTDTFQSGLMYAIDHMYKIPEDHKDNSNPYNVVTTLLTSKFVEENSRGE